MLYKVIIWCHDCTGEDEQGCFGGGTDTIYVDPANGDPILTAERADEIGDEKVAHCGPWDYDVELVIGEPDWASLKADWQRMMNWAKTALAEYKVKG